jgi:hypothetical protein
VNKIPSTEERKKGHKRRRKMLLLLLGLVVVFGIVSSTFLLSPKPKKLDPRRERLSELTLPPDGLKLYSFLLKEIPDIVSEIPCSCCGEYLDACYKGKCAPT